MTMTNETKTSSPEYEPSASRFDCNCNHAKACETNEPAQDPPGVKLDPPGIKDDEVPPETPTRKERDDEEDTTATPRSSRSEGSHSSAPGSKRRRLISFDSNTGLEDLESSARKLNYECLPSDASASEGSITDREEYQYEETRRRTAMKLWEVNYGDVDDRQIATTARCKLFEHVTWFDVVENEKNPHLRWMSKEELEKKKLEATPKWKSRGTGKVKFIQSLEEGYNCGMIRMEMVNEGTLDTIMCHELVTETLMPMASKTGKAYTWMCKDWAYRTTMRTFSIRFDDEIEAVKFKTLAEQSKENNVRVRHGMDVPDQEVDELSDVLKRMSTV